MSCLVPGQSQGDGTSLDDVLDGMFEMGTFGRRPGPPIAIWLVSD